jgi:predicted phage baseplate assembly protein
MTRLAPDLFDRRYDDLVELGRAQLPALAPEWTDHNAHDPGITLLELLAWVTEAQLYSVAHTRRDERRAYATLMGIVPHGTRPGRGLLWRDHEDPGSPAAQFAGIPAPANAPSFFRR